MTKLTLELPDSLYKSLDSLASRRNVTIQQLLLDVAQFRVATEEQVEYLEARAKRGNREKFLAALNKVPDVPPDEFDQLD